MSDTSTPVTTLKISLDEFLGRLRTHRTSVRRRPQLTDFLDGCALSNAVLEDCEITYARSRGTEFQGCTFRDVKFAQSDFGDVCRFRDCVFERCTIDNVNFVRKTEVLNCTFVDCTFKRMHLDDARFGGIRLKDCTFEHQTMIRTSNCELDLDECHFSQLLLERSKLRCLARETLFEAMSGDGTISKSRFESCKILGTLPKSLAFSGCVFAQTRFGEWVESAFPGCEFRRCGFNDSQIRSRELRGCQFDDCAFLDAEFHDVDLKRASFRGARYLQGRCSARSTAVDNADTVWFSHPFDAVTWWRVRWLGSMPLFGASYVTLGAIIALAQCMSWYNARVAVLRDRAVARIGERAETWVERLGPIPVPDNIKLLFVGIVLLAFGATLYKLFCPDLVQEHSENEWKNVLKREVFEYRINSYARPIVRWTCGVFYATGAGVLLFYVVKRVAKTAAYLFGWM